jgi:hypothetical protein
MVWITMFHFSAVYYTSVIYLIIFSISISDIIDFTVAIF